MAKNRNAKELISRGVTVTSLYDSDELSKIHEEFVNTITSFPEYIHPTTDSMFVFPIFGALGNPASFHSPLVRNIRRRANRRARKIFRSLERESSSPRKIEQLFDRMCIRRKGTKMSPESWHRDVYDISSNGDDIFGGWVNLDREKSQFFSCVPGTHRDAVSESGFAKISKNQDFTNKELIEIPPGCWIIFYQQIVHEVKSILIKNSDEYRLFLGFRLTHSDEPLIGAKALEECILYQGVPPSLPGGMEVSMYFKSNERYQQSKLIEWSKQTFKDECLNDSGMVHRIMRSLSEYDMDMYPNYTFKDKAILLPSRLSI